ncbi:MAG: signal peptidase II [Rhodothermaceae bacterium]|nr:signal peptidase II [Rhodothermaceae bacterium]
MHLIWIALVIIAIDQATKLIVYNTMTIQESIPIIGDWLRFTYTENPGMAFGINFGPDGLVTALSISATLLICLYLYKVKDSYFWYSVSIACILGGALGNIIDRVLYGYLFYDAPLFTGRVIDFIHLNLWKGYLPNAIPVIGGKYAALFPIWNVADMAIVMGVIGILVYQNKFQESLLAQSENPVSAEENDGVTVNGNPQEEDVSNDTVVSDEPPPNKGDALQDGSGSPVDQEEFKKN